jgi:hypothetical protein
MGHMAQGAVATVAVARVRGEVAYALSLLYL